MTHSRAERALTDVVAVEQIAPGMMVVTTWSDTYPVDARDAGCNCPDKRYGDDTPMCKHEYAALLADTSLPSPFIVTDNLYTRDEIAADGSGEERPSDCDCWGQNDLACWPCYRDGFETPAGGEA